MQIQAILRELCPRCHKGKIFRGPLWRTYLAMYERCPECALKYEREQGYFLGAMYFSYLLSIAPVLVLVLLLWWLTGWRFDLVLGAAFVVFTASYDVIALQRRLFKSRHWLPRRPVARRICVPDAMSRRPPRV